MNVGVLGLQGCIDPHLNHLKKLNVQSLPVRSKQDLAKVDRLILPGGESSTMLKLLESSDLFDELKKFGTSKPIWGVCAGAILLAQEVVHPSQKSLGLIRVRATRNYYGSQLQSFKATITPTCLSKPIEVDFIRAPLLEALSAEVKTLASHQGQSVALQKENIIVTAFHTELGVSSDMHQYFLDM